VAFEELKVRLTDTQILPNKCAASWWQPRKVTLTPGLPQRASGRIGSTAWSRICWRTPIS